MGKIYGAFLRAVGGLSSAVRKKEVVAIPKLTDQGHLLEGKIALITGGNSGIGYAIAEAFIACGAKVVIAGTNENKLQSACSQLGKQSRYIKLDVTNVSEMDQHIKNAFETFEEGRIDILVNSAGVTNHSDFQHMTEEEYDSIMDINAKGTFFVSQVVSKYMIEQGIRGHILNVSSSSALRPAWTPYQMSKWAVRGFTIGLADTLLPYGIVVNAIAPGPVATPMLGRDDTNLQFEKHPCKRLASPSEIANLAVLMVSDMGNLIVGDTFYITGGSGIITNKC